jgi:hypothetical protein
MGQSRGHTARDCAYPRYIPAEQMFSEASSPPFEIRWPSSLDDRSDHPYTIYMDGDGMALRW